MGWSPEQIAGRMELDGSEHRVSAEFDLPPCLQPGRATAGLPRLLAQRKPKRGRRRRNGRREPAIPNRTPIHQRPTKAHLRSQFGHWEGDLMHFRRQRDILLTLQERRSRLTLARRLHSKDADLAAEAIAGELGGLFSGLGRKACRWSASRPGTPRRFSRRSPTRSDRNDARGIAQMMRVKLYRPVHVKTLRSQHRRALLSPRASSCRRRRSPSRTTSAACCATSA